MNHTPPSPPTPPQGYQPAYQVHYPASQLRIASISVFLLSIPLFGGLAWRLQGAPLEGVFEISSLWPLVLLTLIAVAAYITLVVVHELVHGLAFRLCGYRVSYGILWELPAAYAAAFEQFQRRNHAMLVAAAPLIVINALLVPMLAISNLYVVAFALIMLIVNTAGAVGDVYIIGRMLRMPRDTLLYDVDAMHMYVFAPAADNTLT